MMKNISLFILILFLTISFTFATDIIVKSDGTSSDGNGISFQNSASTELLIIEGDGAVQAKQGRIKDKSGFVSPVGSLLMYAGSTAPEGWLLCNGSNISREDYSDLFSTIGETYGSGDGSSTFSLPDLRGRMPLGLDNMGGTSANTVTNSQADALNGKDGSENHTLTENEMPGHTHNTAAGRNASGSSTAYVQNELMSDIASVGDMVSKSTGGGAAHNNMPPFIALNYIIKH